MPAFLNDITPFLGTGQNNEDDLTLAEFLEEYDPYHYKNPSVTTDVLVFRHPEEFTQVENGMKLLMVKRRNHPSIGYWALPGGFVNVDEDLELAAKRELEEETGLTGISIEMVSTYGEADRDPRGRIITVSYLALLNEKAEVKAGDDAADACFVDVEMKEFPAKMEVREGKEKTVRLFSLHLTNAKKGLDLEAVVEQEANIDGILKETKYHVLSSKGIAFDHPRFIVEALLYVKTAMELAMNEKNSD